MIEQHRLLATSPQCECLVNSSRSLASITFTIIIIVAIIITNIMSIANNSNNILST